MRARETVKGDGAAAALDELEREAEPHLTAAFQPTAEALAMLRRDTSLLKREVAQWRGEAGGTGPRKLPSEVRGDLEQATGRSLEHVQLHDGAEGAAVATQHGARAVAIGRDIHMGAGQLDAATPDGRELIAHEVAHVVQADAQPGPAVASAKADGTGCDNDAERDADGFAASFRERGGSASWSPSVSVSGGTPLRKQPGQQQAQQPPSVTALDYVASDPYLDQHLRENLATLQIVGTGPFARFLAKSTFDDLLIKSLVPGSKNLVEDLKHLVAPESLEALVDRSRGRDWEQKDDQPRPTQTDKGPASRTYLRPVVLEVANAIARRYDESMKRVFPRVLGLHLEKQNAKGSPEAPPSANLVKKDEVVISHPMDFHTAHGLVGAQGAVDFLDAAKDHPNLAKIERVQHGIATVRRATPRWHWLEATPANATAEQVSTAVFGKPEEAHRLIPMPPLWGFHPADAALMTPGVKKLFQTDAFMPSAPGGGMPRKLARALGLDWGADEVEDIDPVAELTSGSKGELAMQRAKARLAEKEAREAAGAGPDAKKDKEAKDAKPAMPAHDEADVYAELKDAVDLLDKIHLQLPLFGLSPRAASDAWGRLNFRKEKLTKKQSIPDVDAAFFLAFEQRGLLSRVAKGLADAGGKLVAAGGAAAPSTVRDPLREVAQPFHDAVVALELPELAEPRVARAEQLLLLSQASILEAKLHEGMPQIENAKQGERIGAADFNAESAEGRTTNHLLNIAQARRTMLADPLKAQAELDQKTKKVDDLEFEIGIGEKLAHLDQIWTALRDNDDFWLSPLGGAIDTVLRDENRDIFTELKVRVFTPFQAAEMFKYSTKPEDLQQQNALKKMARDAYREIVTSSRFVKHAQRVSKFLTVAAKQKKWAKIIVGLGIAFAAFALGQWQFAAVLADGGGVFAAAVAGGVVTTGATVAMEKLILGHDPTIGMISTGLIFNFGTFFMIGKLAEAARVAGVQAELAAGAKGVEASTKATKAGATAEGAGAAADATGAAATAGSKAGKAVKGLTQELFVSEVMGVVQGQAASLIDQGRLLNEAEMIELAIQGAVAVVGMRVGQAMHDGATASLRAAKIESINRDVAWLDAERGEIAAQAKELEATKLDPDAPIDRGKAFALLDRWRVYLERERAVGEKVLAYAEKHPKQFKPDAVAEMRKDLAASPAEVNQVRAMASIAALEPIGPGSYRVEPAGLDGIIQQQRSAGAEIARVETDPYTGQRKITIKPSDGSPPFTITEALPERAMRTAMKIEGGEAKPFEQWLDAESRKRPGDAQIGQLREIYLRDPRAAINLAAERNGYRPREMKVPEPLVQVDGKAAAHQRGTGEVLTNGHELAQQIGGGVFAIADDTFVAQPHQVGELRLKWKEKFGHDPGPGHYDAAKNAVYFEGDVNVGGKRTTVRVQADLAPRIDSFAQLDAGTNRVVGQPVDLATGHEILRQLNRGEAGALKATGISGEPRMPADRATEFGIGETSDRRAVIIRGMRAAVDWIGLPGITPRGHTHPPVPGNSLREESVPLVELISPTRDPHVYRELVFPSASDFAVMAQQKVDGHKVHTGFVVKNGMVSQAHPTDHTTPRLEFEIRLPKEVGQRDGGERVYHATAEGRIGGKGEPLIAVDIWATHNQQTETGHLFMSEPSGVKPITAPKTSGSQKTGMASDPKALAEKRTAFTEIVDAELAKGKKLSTPHEVRVLDADAFAERFRSERGRAAFVLENDRGVIYASTEATPAEVKSETYHLRQLEDPKVGPEIRRLSDTDLGKWDQMSVADRMDHHRRKLAIEIDAHERMLADGDRTAKATLDNLRELRKQVDAIPPEQISEMNAGLREVPDALKDPAHLFSKETVAVGKTGDRGDKYAKKNRAPVPPKGSSRSAAWSKDGVASVEQLGSEWREELRITSDDDGTVVAVKNDSVVVRDATGEQHIYTLEVGAKTTVKKGDWVRAGETLAIENNRDYRLVEIEHKDGTKHRREEIRKLDDAGWVQRGSESTRRGRIMEDAAERQANAELGARKRKDPTLSSVRVRHNRGGGGFDDVIVEFTGTGDKMVAKIRIREVKDYPGRYVPLEEFTAIRGQGLKNNMDVLQRRVDDARRALDNGEEPKHFEGEVSHEHVDAIDRALSERNVEVEVVLGPDTMLGAEGKSDNSVLKRLKQEVNKELGSGAFKLEGGEPDRVRPTWVDQAKKAADK